MRLFIALAASTFLLGAAGCHKKHHSKPPEHMPMVEPMTPVPPPPPPEPAEPQPVRGPSP